MEGIKRVILLTVLQDWYKVENSEGKQGFVPANHLKRAEPVIKSSQERLAEEARTVSDRQKQIEKQYADLTEAAEKKERALKLRIEMYKVSGNAKNLINWTTKKVKKLRGYLNSLKKNDLIF